MSDFKKTTRHRKTWKEIQQRKNELQEERSNTYKKMKWKIPKRFLLEASEIMEEGAVWDYTINSGTSKEEEITTSDPRNKWSMMEFKMKNKFSLEVMDLLDQKINVENFEIDVQEHSLGTFGVINKRDSPYINLAFLPEEDTTLKGGKFIAWFSNTLNPTKKDIMEVKQTINDLLIEHFHENLPKEFHQSTRKERRAEWQKRFEDDYRRMPKEKRIEIAINNIKDKISSDSHHYTKELIGSYLREDFEMEDWQEISKKLREHDIYFTPGVSDGKIPAVFIMMKRGRV